VTLRARRGRTGIILCLLEVCENITDSFESIVQVFGRATVAEELITVRVFDEEVSVRDIVSKFGNLVETG